MNDEEKYLEDLDDDYYKDLDDNYNDYLKNISTAKDDALMKSIAEERIAQQREEERKNASLSLYNKLMKQDSCQPKLTKELCDIGHRYKDVIDEKDYDSILSVLDKIRVPEGFSLDVKDRDLRKDIHLIPNFVNGMHVGIVQSWGETCTLFLTLPDGQIKDDLFSYLIVDESLMGAWQALLLYLIYYFVPRFDHYLGFEYGLFILNANDTISLKKQYPNLFDYQLKRNKTILSNFRNRLLNRKKLPDCSIKAVSNKDSYFISFCLFLSEHGLSRRTYEVIISNSKVQSISLISDEEIQRRTTVLEF